MTDSNGNGIKKDLEWLHNDLDEVKANYRDLVELLRKMDDKMDGFFQNECPVRHSSINEKLARLETRVYVIVTIGVILFNLVGKYIVDKIS